MDLVQIAKGNAFTALQGGVDRKPRWLKVRAPGGSNYAEIRRLMRGLGLHTVCE
ncbi:MAG: lipoyl synthase, partial [Acidimicrobiia bacterium]